MIQWPAGSKSGDRMRVDINVLRKTSGIISVLSSFNSKGIVF